MQSEKKDWLPDYNQGPRHEGKIMGLIYENPVVFLSALIVTMMMLGGFILNITQRPDPDEPREPSRAVFHIPI